jgi:predicted transcriptional regulator
MKLSLEDKETLHVLHCYPKLRPTEHCKITEITRQAWHARLRNLLRIGLIERSKKGEYKITKIGSTYLI